MLSVTAFSVGYICYLVCALYHLIRFVVYRTCSCILFNEEMNIAYVVCRRRLTCMNWWWRWTRDSLQLNSGSTILKRLYVVSRSVRLLMCPFTHSAIENYTTCTLHLRVCTHTISIYPFIITSIPNLVPLIYSIELISPYPHTPTLAFDSL